MRVRDILVPVDFSSASLGSVDKALQFVEPNGQVCLLHVVDTKIVNEAAAAGLGTRDELGSRFREQALQRMERLMERDTVLEARARGVQVQTMVAIGVPFAEIIRLAEDMDFALIMLALRSEVRAENLLFGSTTEKIMRASTVPLLCLPNREVEGLSPDTQMEQPATRS